MKDVLHPLSLTYKAGMPAQAICNYIQPLISHSGSLRAYFIWTLMDAKGFWKHRKSLVFKVASLGCITNRIVFMLLAIFLTGLFLRAPVNTDAVFRIISCLLA